MNSFIKVVADVGRWARESVLEIAVGACVVILAVVSLLKLPEIIATLGLALPELLSTFTALPAWVRVTLIGLAIGWAVLFGIQIIFWLIVILYRLIVLLIAKIIRDIKRQL